MIPATKDSMAYDLSMFENQNMAVTQKQYEKKLEKKAVKKALSPVKIVGFVLVFATLAAILLSYSQLTEISAEVASLKSQLTKLQEEENRLTIALDEKTSLRSVEDFAKNELGMRELQSYQIVYLPVNNADKVEVNQEKGPLENISDKITQTFNAVLEYLR